MGKIILSVAIFALLAPLGAILGWKCSTKIDNEAGKETEQEVAERKRAEKEECERRDLKKSVSDIREMLDLKADITKLKERVQSVITNSDSEFSPSNHKQRR